MKRLSTLVAMAVMLSSLTGCCCWSPWSGNQCGGNGCGYPSYGQPMVPQGTTYQSYDSVTGLPVQTTAYQPVIAAPTVALGPLEALPTYR